MGAAPDKADEVARALLEQAVEGRSSLDNLDVELDVDDLLSAIAGAMRTYAADFAMRSYGAEVVLAEKARVEAADKRAERLLAALQVIARNSDYSAVTACKAIVADCAAQSAEGVSGAAKEQPT